MVAKIFHSKSSENVASNPQTQQKQTDENPQNNWTTTMQKIAEFAPFIMSIGLLLGLSAVFLYSITETKHDWRVAGSQDGGFFGDCDANEAQHVFEYLQKTILLLAFLLNSNIYTFLVLAEELVLLCH